MSTSGDIFYYPNYATHSIGGDYGNNLVWQPGSQQNIQWKADLDSYNVALYHQMLDARRGNGIQAAIVTSYNGNGAGWQTFSWTVTTYDTDNAESPIYYFWVNPGKNGKTSAYFNVTDPPPTGLTSTSSTTFSTSVTSTISSSSTRSTSSNVIASEISHRTSSPKSTGSSSSSTLKIGLGVGLGLGIPLILLLGALLGIVIVRKKRLRKAGREWSQNASRLSPYCNNGEPLGEDQHPGYSELDQTPDSHIPPLPIEVPASARICEAQGEIKPVVSPVEME